TTVNAMAKEAVDNGDSVTVKYEVKGEAKEITADYVLVSVGRRANTADLGLEAIGVELTERGLVKVDNQGRTSVKNFYAIGDITPGAALDRKSTRLNSSHVSISYAVFCLNKKRIVDKDHN